MEKIIDRDGKLFGKINVVDFLCLLFVILLLPMIYHGYRLTSAKVKHESGGFHPEQNIPLSHVLAEVNDYAQLRLRNLLFEESEYLKENIDKLDAGSDMEVMEILGIEKRKYALGETQSIELYTVLIKVKVPLTLLRRKDSNIEIRFRNQLLNNQTLIVTLGNYRFEGVIERVK